jgi:DNA-binding NarL/FixJ family response regulator
MNESHTTQASVQLKRVLVVQNGKAGTGLLSRVLEQEPAKDLWICGTIFPADDVAGHLGQQTLHLVVLENLPLKTTVACIKSGKMSRPETRFVVISGNQKPAAVSRVLQAGADAYILDREDASVLLQAMRDVLKGYIFVSEDILSVEKDQTVRGRSVLSRLNGALRNGNRRTELRV